VRYIESLEMDLLRFVLKQMNITLVHVHTPEGFDIEHGFLTNLVMSMIEKNAYIAIRDVGHSF